MNRSPTVVALLVRNDKLARTISEACQDRGSLLERFGDLPAALARLGEAGGGALVLDLSELSTKSDKKINAAISAIDPSVKILGLGSGYDLKSVTSFYRAGLADFLDLPVEPLLLSRALNNVLGSLADAPPAKAAKPGPSGSPGQPGRAGPEPAPAAEPPLGDQRRPSLASADYIVGQDPGLMKVFRMVEKVAATDSTVMIHGESGTGKELIARAIHQTSPRAAKPMIPVNCGAIPEELLETELFGHEKGAFTNAIRDRIGRFEMADGGTIFLDEIGDMSPKLQVKLLRVIQEHEFERVGGDRTISVSIRIITATHVDLTRAVEDGRFREDLYYRLNVIPLTIPPLRARSGDIPLLVDYFLGRLRETRGSRVTGLTAEVLSALKAYPWPGNIRELENLMERMVILADGPILTRDDLPQRLLGLVGADRPSARGRTVPAPPEPSDLSDPSDLSEPPSFLAGFGALPGASDGPNGPDREAGERAGGGTVESFGGGDSSGRDHENAPPAGLDPAGQSVPRPPEASSSPDAPTGPAAPGTGGAAEPAGAARPLGLPPDLARLVEPIVDFPERGVDLSLLVGDYEERLIKAALKANSGVKNQAAKALGLNRTTFLDKLRKRGLDQP